MRCSKHGDLAMPRPVLCRGLMAACLSQGPSPSEVHANMSLLGLPSWALRSHAGNFSPVPGPRSTWKETESEHVPH